MFIAAYIAARISGVVMDIEIEVDALIEQAKRVGRAGRKYPDITQAEEIRLCRLRERVLNRLQNIADLPSKWGVHSTECENTGNDTNTR
jgi:hypothetical protein